MYAVYVNYGVLLEERVELYRHAETTEYHVSITVLGAKRLVGDLQTWGAVNGAVNSGYLQIERKAFTTHWFCISNNQILLKCASVLLQCGCGPLAH